MPNYCSGVLAGKIALVTGRGAGIGNAIVDLGTFILRMVRMGTDVVTSNPITDDASPVATHSDPIAEAVWNALEQIKDPCHLLSGYDLSIVDLGLINRVDLIGDRIEVGITFTDSTCLFAYRIIADLEDLAPTLPGIASVKVIPEPFPMWDESRLSERARALYADKKRMFGFETGGRTCDDFNESRPGASANE